MQRGGERGSQLYGSNNHGENDGMPSLRSGFDRPLINSRGGGLPSLPRGAWRLFSGSILPESYVGQGARRCSR